MIHVTTREYLGIVAECIQANGTLIRHVRCRIQAYITTRTHALVRDEPVLALTWFAAILDVGRMTARA